MITAFGCIDMAAGIAYPAGEDGLLTFHDSLSISCSMYLDGTVLRDTMHVIAYPAGEDSLAPGLIMEDGLLCFSLLLRLAFLLRTGRGDE